MCTQFILKHDNDDHRSLTITLMTSQNKGGESHVLLESQLEMQARSGLVPELPRPRLLFGIREVTLPLESERT